MSLDVVVSAYACFPDHGSEPEVGYRWVREMAARYRQVTVLTSHWSYERARGAFASNVVLVPLGWRRDYEYKDTNRIFFQILYFAWALHGFLYLRRHIKRGRRADYVLSLTFGGIHMPTALPLACRRSAWGPIGGEICDLRLAFSVSPKLFVRMALMKAGVFLELLNPIWIVSFFGVRRVYVKWRGTRQMLPPSRRIAEMRENGMVAPPNRVEAVARLEKNLRDISEGRRRMLYAGRLKLHKGVTMLRPIMLRLNQLGVRCTLDVVGGGELAEVLRAEADGDTTKAFRFVGRLPREDLMNAYRTYQVLLFPSMNDPSPHVIHEALSEGCIVLAYEETGAADIAHSAGMPVVSKAQSKEEMIEGFAQAIKALSEGKVQIDFAKYVAYLASGTYEQVVQKNLDTIEADLLGSTWLHRQSSDYSSK